MLQEILKLAESRGFFAVNRISQNNVNLCYNKNGLHMKENIIKEWLYSLHSKSKHNFKVLVKDNKKNETMKNATISKQNTMSTPYGLIEIRQNLCTETVTNENEIFFCPGDATELKFNVFLAKSEALQFFLQWQRYRKIWWSTITTSPGFFSLRDITYEGDGAAVDVIANFPWGYQAVENITIQKNNLLKTKQLEDVSQFQSVLTAECALLTLIADGHVNGTREGYLRLHRTIAPYKVSFVIDSKDLEKQKSLRELADLMNYKLNLCGISTWLDLSSNMDKSIEEQFTEAYHLGVPYIAVLNDETLDTGKLQLLNSSTTLKEQIHISDFDQYVLKLFKSCFS